MGKARARREAARAANVQCVQSAGARLVHDTREAGAAERERERAVL